MSQLPDPPALIPAPRPWGEVLRVALPACLAAWLCVLAGFLIPTELDRGGALAELAYWVSFSGKELLAGVGFLGALLLLAREGGRRRTPQVELFGVLFGFALFIGGGALFNEYAIKRIAQVPRPYVLELERTGLLGMSPSEFYALGGKEERRVHLRKVLTAEARPDLRPRVREHWVIETGFSFPSGHSFAAFCCAAFFLALGLSLPLRLKPLLFVLPPWALGVCLSRIVLGVHSAKDVTLGSALGIGFGLFGAYLTRKVLYEPTPVDEER
ncbi:MAG TPA: hypothetical protein DEA08_20985 [Planctomycetes bacterium]|nr:hypothetical protein [Planctomycetota bacterium]